MRYFYVCGYCRKKTTICATSVNDAVNHAETMRCKHCGKGPCHADCCKGKGHYYIESRGRT